MRELKSISRHEIGHRLMFVFKILIRHELLLFQ